MIKHLQLANFLCKHEIISCALRLSCHEKSEKKSTSEELQIYNREVYTTSENLQLLRRAEQILAF